MTFTSLPELIYLLLGLSNGDSRDHLAVNMPLALRLFI